MIGTSLGRYRVLESLGKGGMGEVFLAEDPVLGRKVAVKVLPGEFARDPERRSRLLHEARAASALNHPNIITVHDLGESEGTLYVAVEVVDGVTLNVWADAETRTPAQILRVLRQATQALSLAHAAGLVHRDLKPENLMVRRDGLLKILDFGLARSSLPGGVSRTETIPGTVMGTAPYMSPEQVLGQAAGPPSDVFSLGTILYELLTGKHPFAAASAVETMHRILHETPDPPSKVNAALGPDFDFVLAKALSKDPSRRHATARDLDVDLETLECGCGASAPSPGPGSGPRAIAVLPFKNIGGSPELNYLGVGLADAVITLLSRSPDLIVRATSSVAPYENQPVDPRRVGQELDVSAVLDASFQRFGERFRATARLVETPSGRAVWAGKVDVRFEDMFEVQDQVAQGIAEALTARLAGDGGGGPGARRFTPSAETYELYMRALEAQRLGTKGGFLRAIEATEKAVSLQPEYARGWGELGRFYHAMVDGGYDPDPVWYVKAEEALARARSLDPEDAITRFTTGALRLVRGEKREAYRMFVDCVQRMPNSWMLYHYFGYLFRLCDMPDEGILAGQHAHVMDPSVPWPYWGCVRNKLAKRDTAGAREWMERARARLGAHPHVHRMEITILAAEGRWAEALEMDRKRSADVDSGVSVGLRALCLLKLGQVAEARLDLRDTEKFASVDMDQAAVAAVLHAQLGDPDKAFHYLDRAAALGNDSLSLYLDPEMLGPVHGDPRWAPFLDGVRRRVAQWRREFRWPPA